MLGIVNASPRSTKAGAQTPATVLSHCANGIGFQRSTKAGAQTPATDTAAEIGTAKWIIAQRRPERKLRRQQQGAYAPGPRRAPLNEGRSANSGDSMNRFRVKRIERKPLNEGRSANSGDRRIPRWQSWRDCQRRSTKAGAQTPATVALQ